jgi:sigma-B regulation protein RsbU (phosphoserine phosphatase)
VKFSIRTKLILAIGGPLTVIYLVVWVADYQISKAKAITNMEKQLTELTSRYAAQFEGRFETDAQVARSLATFLTTQPGLKEQELFELLQNVVKDNPRVYGSCMAFEPKAYAGRERFAPYVCREKNGVRRMDLGYEYFGWDWYLIPKLLEHPIWTDPYYDEGAGNVLMCTYSVPFRKAGALRGIVTVDISLEGLRREVEKIAKKIGEDYSALRLQKGATVSHPDKPLVISEKTSATGISGSYCMLISQNGVFISHPDGSLIMCETIFSLAEWYEMPELGDLGRKMLSGASGVEPLKDFPTYKPKESLKEFRTHEPVEPKWVVFAPIPSSGWSFAAVISEAQLMAPVYEELRRNAALLLGEMALVIGIIILTGLQITRPIPRLAKAVHEVASGNLNVQATGINTRDEIGEFAQAFNKMVGDLKSHVEALTRETAAREAVESELRIARKIQASLIPRTFPPFPERRDFDLWAVLAPAKQVAGDFFDFYFITPDQLLITIADVSGKGIPAALFMAVTRTLLKNLAMSGNSPAEMVKKANDLLAEDNDESMFVTLIVGLYDTKTGRLRFTNAGHLPPCRVDPQGNISSPEKATTTIVGIDKELRSAEEELTLNPGDLLLLYTDGVTEAHSPEGQLYGDERFKQLLSNKCASEKVEKVCETIVHTVTDFQKDAQYDDITVLALRRSP